MNRSGFSILRLPRNYNFISRLPENFELKILRRGNETADGIWFYARIRDHELNILSQVELVPGQSYEIKKKDNLTLELGNNTSKTSTIRKPQKDSEYFG